jgi:type IV secretory pathway VirB2 component (pilin)
MRRKDPELLRRTAGAALPGLAATLLLFWQTRTGPAAQMMAVTGAAALGWFLVPMAWNSRFSSLRVAGAVVALVVGAGAAVPFVFNFIPEAKPTPREQAIGKANRLCASMWGMHPVAMQPKGVVMTFVDLGPRLITLTPHDAITGPYHRNGAQIADVMHFWRGDAEQAHAIAQKYHANYVLSCPNSSTSTIFDSETPKGLYGQLQRGQVPKWLTPVDLGKDSPFRMWKVVG